jgi:hypothetical protein
MTETTVQVTLICDQPGCDNGYAGTPVLASFSDATRAGALRRAINAGWRRLPWSRVRCPQCDEAARKRAEGERR